jgi:hypothetical protein
MSGVSTTNIVGITYEAIASGRIQQLKTAMDTVIGAELQFVVPTLKSLLIIFVVRQFTLTFTGNMTVERFVGSCARAAIVVFLISHSGSFVQYVRDPIFDKIPQAISSTILSSAGAQTSSNTTIAQQFDKVSSASDAVTAAIITKQTGWSVASLVNYASASFANFAVQFLLGGIAGVWLLGQSLLAIILCFGPLLLGFELFDRTRGWVDQWIGKLVGMTAFGIGTSILLAIEMTGEMTMLQTVHNNLPNSGPDAVAALLRVGCNVLLDLFTMVALPTICAYGSGVAAALAAPSAMASVRGAAAVASGARTVVTGSARSGTGLGRSASNSINRT